MGKFPHSSLKAHNIFPIHGLAVVVKKNFPIRGYATHGEIFLHQSKPFLGKILCTFRDSWGNLFSNFRGFATQVEKSHPYSSSVWDWPNPVNFRVKKWANLI